MNNRAQVEGLHHSSRCVMTATRAIVTGRRWRIADDDLERRLTGDRRELLAARRRRELLPPAAAHTGRSKPFVLIDLIARGASVLVLVRPLAIGVGVDEPLPRTRAPDEDVLMHLKPAGPRFIEQVGLPCRLARELHDLRVGWCAHPATSRTGTPAARADGASGVAKPICNLLIHDAVSAGGVSILHSVISISCWNFGTPAGPTRYCVMLLNGSPAGWRRPGAFFRPGLPSGA